jgi:hypothetical protein
MIGAAKSWPQLVEQVESWSTGTIARPKKVVVLTGHYTKSSDD